MKKFYAYLYNAFHPICEEIRCADCPLYGIMCVVDMFNGNPIDPIKVSTALNNYMKGKEDLTGIKRALDMMMEEFSSIN